jgi:hypothetical protein
MQTYDPGKYTLIVGGAIIGGFADGTFIKAGRTTDTFKMHIGTDGTAARVRSRDKSGKYTVTLLQTSPSNEILSALAITDELTGAGVVPVLLKDGNGTTTVASLEAWVMKPAEVDLGKDLGNREWVIEAGDMDIFNGGVSA